MMKKRILYFITAIFFLPGFTKSIIAQSSPVQKQKVAVFAPLYLDSAFDAGSGYRYDKNFPKFLNPGLEFYEGVQLALDSLNKERSQLEVFVYDTRSSTPIE